MCEVDTEFVEGVERRAEDNVLKTNKLEGAHYAAMKAELAAAESKKPETEDM